MTGLVVSGDRTLSGAELYLRAAQAAVGLKYAGLDAGDAVALLMRNDPALFEATRAAALIGASSVPINWHFGPDEVGHILRDSGARVLVAHADLLAAVKSAIPTGTHVFVVETPSEIAAAYGLTAEVAHVPRDATEWSAWLSAYNPAVLTPASVEGATIVYTSGTTGTPKGVRRVANSPEAAAKARVAIAQLYDIRADARTAITGPMYHSALSAYGLGMASVGASVWLMPRFNAEELLAMIEAHRLTHLHLVPIMFTRLLKLPEAVRRRYDVSSLAHVVHAAAPCPPEVKRRMIEWWGPIIHEYFGSTETRAIAACNSAEWLAHPGTVGRILPGTEVEIVGDDGMPVEPGQPGEIFARNHAVEDFTYTGDDAKRMAVERNGLITAGDVGYLDQDGFLFLCDRRRDMVNSGGVNIYPAEIEACLLEMPGVRDCAVFGIPDPEYGESVAAAVQPEPGATLEVAGVQAFVRQHLARYKAPKLVEIHAELPRDDSGKIFKQKLRAPHWQAAGRKI